jgi:hypothetical protein
MKKLVIAGAAALLLSACITSPIPANYSGPLAVIRDTSITETANRSQFFFLAEINGEPVANGRSVSKRSNTGRGFGLSPQGYLRQVPAQQATFTLKAEVEYGAPIQAMLNAGTLYKAERKLTFTPQSQKTYVVKGTLTADKQDVWLEDDAGQRVQ